MINLIESHHFGLTSVDYVRQLKELIACLFSGDSGTKRSLLLGVGLLKIQMMPMGMMSNMAAATLESMLNIWIRFCLILASGPRFTWFDTWPGLISFSFLLIHSQSHSLSCSQSSELQLHWETGRQAFVCDFLSFLEYLVLRAKGAVVVV